MKLRKEMRTQFNRKTFWKAVTGPRCRKEDIIKMDLKDIIRMGVGGYGSKSC